MQARCPICEGFMDSKMYCKKCGIVIDRARRKCATSSTVTMKLQQKFLDAFNNRNWIGVQNLKFDEPLFPNSDGTFMIDGVVTDMFHERTLQLIRMGGDVKAVGSPSKSTFETYLFERWCLLNVINTDKWAEEYFQILCSPTLEEKLNRVYKVFSDEAPKPREGLDAAYGFIANPVSGFALPGEGGEKCMNFFVSNWLQFLTSRIAELQPLPEKPNLSFYKEYYGTSVSVLLNDYQSMLVADGVCWMQAPAKFTKVEMETFEYAKKYLTPICNHLVTHEYKRRYGFLSKERLLSEWGIIRETDDVALDFWRAVNKKLNNKEFVRR